MTHQSGAGSSRPPSSGSVSSGSVSGEPLLDFLDDMRRLRRDCPWKRAQTHRSLARYLQEESAETLEALDTGDEEHLREELGDLLLQVYFHAVIAEEAGAFTLDDVAAGIAAKMRRRNPHVFGPEPGADVLSAQQVEARWQQIKADEKPRRSAYDGIAPGLPALLLATKILERRPVAASGLPAPDDSSADLGDRLLALVAEAVDAGTDPEQALRDAVRRVHPPER
jgi:XTP/dITP diphosphohydrolase